jgi:DNA-binding winged helix-turn-helix (wHTH) protein
MDMTPRVRRSASPCHESLVKTSPSFPEEVFKGGRINELRTATYAPSAESRAIAFGPRPGTGEGIFTFDRVSRLLSKDGIELPLPPRVLGVLGLLLDRPGELVTKQELIAAVWRDAFVTETSLAEAISVLRQALGDDSQHPTYIQTLHRRGYRFIADIRDVAPPLIADARVAAPTAPEAVVEEPEPRLSLLVPWIITLFALLVASVAVWRYLNTAAPPALTPVRFTIALPGDLTLASAGEPVAISGDGSLIAAAACRGTECGIYLRPLSQAEPTLVAGTTGGASPFFSPDGRWLGYFASGRLQKIALGGGSPVILAAATEPLGATWLREGQVVFARSSSEGLFIVPSGGGAAQVLTMPSHGQGGHRWPSALPDGSGVVFTVTTNGDRSEQSYAGVVSMRTRAWGRLLDDVIAARVPIPGYLVAQRGNDLIASAFDDRGRTIAGLPVAVASSSAVPVPQFAVSASGVLLIAPPGSTSIRAVLNWDGEIRRLVPAPQPTLLR